MVLARERDHCTIVTGSFWLLDGSKKVRLTNRWPRMDQRLETWYSRILAHQGLHTGRSWWIGTNNILYDKKLIKNLSSPEKNVSGLSTTHMISSIRFLGFYSSLCNQRYLDSPRRWKPLHFLSMVISAAGVTLLLISRAHYTIDVIISYWISTRVFWIYHTLAAFPNLRVCFFNFINKDWPFQMAK